MQSKCKLGINECACGACIKPTCQYKGCHRCTGMSVRTYCAMFEDPCKDEEGQDYEFLYK